MGMKDLIRGKRLYLDTNVLIYLFEGFPTFRHVLTEMTECADAGEASLFTGEITIAELMVIPFKKDQPALIKFYMEALEDKRFIKLLPSTQKVYLKTAYLRATQPKMKTPDAIHVATAVEGAMDVFITNDAGIKTPDGLERLLLSDLIPANPND